MTFLVKCAVEKCKRVFEIAPTRRERVERTLLRHRFCSPCFSNPDILKRSSKAPHENLVKIKTEIERISQSMLTTSTITAQGLRPDLGLGHVRQPDKNKRRFYAKCESCSQDYKLPPNNKHWNESNVRRCKDCRHSEQPESKDTRIDPPVSEEEPPTEPVTSTESVVSVKAGDALDSKNESVYEYALARAQSERTELVRQCDDLADRLRTLRARRGLIEELVNKLVKVVESPPGSKETLKSMDTEGTRG